MTEEKTIDELLREARKRAGTYGQLYGAQHTADDYLKTTYASLYEDVPEEFKTVPERDAWIRRQPAYRDAIERKRDAYANFKTAETYLKLLFAEVDVWRSNMATNRQLDKLHL